MSGFTRTNGDLQQVAVFDAPVYTNSGVDAITSGVPVQPQGPKLDFFTLQADANISANVGTVISSVVKAIEQLTTVHMYEFYANSTGADYISFATYPTGEFASQVPSNQTQTSANIANAISNIANAATSGSYTWTANLVATFG